MFLIVVLAIGCTAIGFIVGKSFNPTQERPKKETPPIQSITDKEKQKELERQDRAFRDLMSYNIDTAYGIHKIKDGG